MPHTPKTNLFQKRTYWWINYSVNGKRRRISTGTKEKELAEIKRKDLELKLFKGEISDKAEPKNRPLLSEFFRRYTEYIQSDSQIDKHADISRLRILQDYFARKEVRYLDAITPGMIDDFRVTVLVGRKPKTVKNYITFLKTALNRAVTWELIEFNPISKIKPPRIVKTFHFYDENEIERLIAEANEPLKTGIIILVNTGMRTGELFHLRWRDVNLKNGSLRVWPYEGYSPKGKRPRRIPITAALNKILQGLSKGKGPDDYVYRFNNDPRALYERFAPLLKRQGMKGTLHDLRHTFASHLAMAGVPIPVIKELLGHSDIATTMIYAHLSPEAHSAAIELLPHGWCPDGAQNAPKLPKITQKNPAKRKQQKP
jgi:integrase